MDGWMDRWMDGRVDGWMDGWMMDGKMDGHLSVVCGGGILVHLPFLLERTWLLRHLGSTVWSLISCVVVDNVLHVSEFHPYL
jgi:hypothetical protein